MLQPDSGVADMNAQQDSRRHYVGSIRDLVKAGCVGFVATAVGHAGFFCQEGCVQRFIVDARASNRLFLNPSIWTVAHRGGTLPCRISRNASGLSELVLWVRPTSRTRFTRCAFRVGCKRFFVCTVPLFSHPKLTTQERTVDQNRLAPDSLIYLVPTTLPMVFH